MVPVAACSWLALLGPLPLAQGYLLAPELRDLLHEELSGELAKEHVIAITRHHRVQGSRGYLRAAEYVLAELRRAGFDEQHAWIETYPSDGKIHYQTWQSPSGWDIESAELRLLEPAGAPNGELLAAFPEIAMSLVTYSNPGDVTAELVWVGAGTSPADYQEKDVRGKFVLATGYGGAVHREAVLQRGAAAVVCYLDDQRAAEHPDMLQYTGMWPRPDELEGTTFGFNLTNRTGARLCALLASGERVVLRGRVTGTGLEPFVMAVVVAHLPGAGRPDEELLFSAHLDHPKESANDNASGSAAILDIARALRRLIDERRLPVPERSLRFLWVPEWHGTMAYVDAHPELLGPTWGRGGRVLANLNLDMVGEHLELLHSKLILTRSPLSVPSALDDVVADMAAMVDALDVRTPRGSRSAFNYRQVPYAGGSDHMMFLDRGIPSVMFSHDPDYTHHTSEDTPDKVDPVQLERCEILAAGTLWYLANLEERQALDLAWLTAAGCARRVDDEVRHVRGWLAAAPEAARAELVREADLALRSRARVEEQALLSVLWHFDRDDPIAAPALERLVQERSADLRERVEGARRSLASEFGDAAPAPSPHGSEALFVARKTRGPLAFDLPASRLPPERAAWYRAEDFPFGGDGLFELVNLANTGASLGEIRDLYSAQFEPVDQAHVTRFFEDLAALGLAELVPSAPGAPRGTGD
jgi:hypothetical protein